jgi:pyruvate kinase
VSISGTTAQNVAKFRPVCPIIACTPDTIVQRQLKLVWGVIDTATLFTNAVDTALASGNVKKGDLVVLTAGIPVGHSGTTNMLKVHVVGEKILVS